MEMPLLKTSEVAQLAGVEQRRVERLLENENVYLDGIAHRPGEKKHRRFSIIDPFRVEMILALNEHGVVPAKVASGIVEQILNPYPSLMNEPSIPLPDKWNVVFNTLKKTNAHVWFDQQQERFVCASYSDRPDGSGEFFGTPEAARQMAENSRDVYIVVNVARMAGNYLDRLDEFLQKGES